MDGILDYTKKFGLYTLNKAKELKDNVVTKVTDENFQKSVKDNISACIDKSKELTTSTIDYFKDPNLVDNLKHTTENVYNKAKDGISAGITKVKDPVFQHEVSENVKKNVANLTKTITNINNEIENYTVFDFDNLTEDQKKYLINLSDDEVNRRFSQDEIIIISQLKQQDVENNKKHEVEDLEVEIEIGNEEEKNN